MSLHRKLLLQAHFRQAYQVYSLLLYCRATTIRRRETSSPPGIKLLYRMNNSGANCLDKSSFSLLFFGFKKLQDIRVGCLYVFLPQINCIVAEML